MAEASLTVRVTPRAATNEVSRISDDLLSVRTTSAPVDGAANKSIVKLLSDALGCSKSSLRIKSGETSRNKVFVIEGVDKDELRQRIGLIKSAKEKTST